MRILFTSVPQAGHITPLIPLARAFIAADDDVLWASGPDAEPTLGANGIPFHRVGPAFEEWFVALRKRTRGMPGDGLPPERIERYFIPRLFAEIGAPATVDGLLEAARSFQPDLVVFDPTSFAAPLVSALVGVPSLQHAIGPQPGADVIELVADAMSPLWREFGLTVPPDAGLYTGSTLNVCPPSLDPAGERVPRALALRPVPLPVAPPPECPIPRSSDAQLVYVTLGTFSNNLDLFAIILDGLASAPVDVVVTIGVDKNPSDLRCPPNARIESFIPQADLLPHCAAVIHHAGAGTSFGVLAHGLPSVVLPQSADNFTIADRLYRAGASARLLPAEVNPGAVAQALQTVLQGASYHSAARRLATEIADMPGPDEVAASLHAAYRPRA